MDRKIINYHFLIRILGVIGIYLLIGFSEYRENLGFLLLLTGIYILNSILAWRTFGIYKYKRGLTLNLFFDITMLSLAIGTRGGLRSDFYLGYFLILGYVLLIKDNYLLLKLSAWIVVNYSLVTYLYTDSDVFSFGRLFIRLALLVGTTLLLNQYSKMLISSEVKYYKALQNAVYDQLTGAYNRNLLDHIDLKDMAASEHLYICMIDIDNFKAINDTFGHIKGDDVLIQLAGIIRQEINHDSFCIRYGGEEFLLLLKDEHLQRIEHLIKLIRKRLLDSKFSWLPKDIHITFTAGLSQYILDEALEHAIERSDQALYKGKHSGKNCTIIYEQASLALKTSSN